MIKFWGSFFDTRLLAHVHSSIVFARAHVLGITLFGNVHRGLPGWSFKRLHYFDLDFERRTMSTSVNGVVGAFGPGIASSYTSFLVMVSHMTSIFSIYVYASLVMKDESHFIYICHKCISRSNTI